MRIQTQRNILKLETYKLYFCFVLETGSYCVAQAKSAVAQL